MRVRVIHVPRRGEVTNPVHGNLHGEIDEVLSRSPLVFESNGLEVYRHPATSPHVPNGTHDVYWLNEPQFGQAIAWDDGSVQRVFENKDFWLGYESFLRTQQQEVGDTARAYMYWGFHLPSDDKPEFPVVWRGLQSQPRLHFHVADSIEHENADDWLDSAQSQHIGHVARFLNLAGERSQESILADRKFGDRFVHKQQIFGNENETVDRTLYAFPTLAEAVDASLTLRNDIVNEWLMMSLALTQAGPAVFSGQAFNVLQSAVPNFVYVLPSEHDVKRVGRSGGETWVAPFSVIGAPETLTHGGVYLERR